MIVHENCKNIFKPLCNDNHFSVQKKEIYNERLSIFMFNVKWINLCPTSEAIVRIQTNSSNEKFHIFGTASGDNRVSEFCNVNSVL